MERSDWIEDRSSLDEAPGTDLAGEPPEPPGAGWWRLYGLGVAVYAGFYVSVFLAIGWPLAAAVRLAVANLLPVVLAGPLVLRLYRRGLAVRTEPRRILAHVGLGLLFAVGCAGATNLLIYLLDERYQFELGSALWMTAVAGLVFALLAAAGHARRVQETLQRARERVVRAEGLRARAELAALRARLNPHFLFNTLHSLRVLVRQDPARAAQALEQLGDLMRSVLDADADGLDRRTVHQEWRLAETYLDLERLRLGERLRVDANLDPAVAHVALPALTLQPLVENAVHHAIAPRSDGGVLRLRAERRDGRAWITVADDGPGMSDADLARAPGQGLALVGKRLELFYEGEATLELVSPPEGGLEVRISLPLEAT